MSSPIRLLIADDDAHVRTSLAAWFEDEGYAVSVATNGREALDLMGANAADVLLTDIKMPEMDGLELQRRISQLCPSATVIVMTAFADVGTAVRAIKDGAFDYITKPFDPEALSLLVRKASERHQYIRENRALKQRLAAVERPLITAGEGAMGELLQQVALVAPTPTSVLITGESGTGKELVARRIVALSGRAHGPLVVVNCGALSEGVLESELFGHEKGAFTGAAQQRVGRIEQAHGGTLFLDEIGDVPPKVQVDLLRVLEERVLRRVGGNETISVDFRLVAATHQDLEAMVEQGRFRKDLYFRINVFRLRLPRLAERPEDIPLLARHFLARLAAETNRRITDFTPEAMAHLCAHTWPGNVRELHNAVERAVVLCPGGRIGVAQLPFGAAQPEHTLAAVEEAHIRRVLAASASVSQTARLLGIDRGTLYTRMKRYGIERP